MSSSHGQSPGPEHQILAQLSGTWEGPEVLMPAPGTQEKHQRMGRIQARMLEQFFLISDYVQKQDDAVTYRGHGVYSYDARERKYVMYWFDSMGGAGGVAKGEYADGVLTFLNHSPMGQHRYRYTFLPGKDAPSAGRAAPSRLRFEMSMSRDGKAWHEFLVGEYQRP